MGRLDEALKFLNEALEYWRQTGNLAKEAELLEKIGDIYVSKDKIEEAVYLYTDAIDMYEEFQYKEKSGKLREKIDSLQTEKSIV